MGESAVPRAPLPLLRRGLPGRRPARGSGGAVAALRVRSVLVDRARGGGAQQELLGVDRGENRAHGVLLVAPLGTRLDEGFAFGVDHLPPQPRVVLQMRPRT